MTTTITSVNNKVKITDSEFIKLTIELTAGGFEVYTFSSAYKEEVINGQTYLPTGSFLSISQHQKSIESTNFDTTVALAGIDSQNIFIALSPTYKLKGSKIEIYRGFYNDAYILTETSLRFTGIINNFTISEDQNENDLSYSVALTCSNFKTIFENKRSGRFTNKASWQKYNPTDKSMNRIETLHNKAFDFGRDTWSYGPYGEA